MDSSKAMKTMVERCGKSARAVSTEAGRTPDYLGSIFYRGSSPTLATAAQIADVCGYSVALTPKADVPPSALVIDPPAGAGRAEGPNRE